MDRLSIIFSMMKHCFRGNTGLLLLIGAIRAKRVVKQWISWSSIVRLPRPYEMIFQQSWNSMGYAWEDG